ncbi:hypothetical protein NMG60_11003731 [Bertholletia excelsa]
MYGDSRALAADPTAIFSNLKGQNQIVNSSRKLFSNRDMNNQDEYRQYHQSNSGSGLLRFRSAPSSLLSDFDGVGGDSGEKGQMNNHDFEDRKPLANGYSLNSQLPPQYPRQSSGSATQLDNNNSQYRMVGLGSASGLNGSSNLTRQSSSPAGLFSHLTTQNDKVSEVLNSLSPNSSRKGALCQPVFKQAGGPMNFSSGVPSSLGMLSQISELENESVGGSCHNDLKLGNGSREPQFYSPSYSFGSWSDSSQFQENFSVLRRDLDSDGKLFAATQKGELENRMHVLSHHLSLPKTSAEMAAMEKLLQFQDTVPCKVRAKRGCATHPRSIAERVRRTRISERMRKLQDLVPNMDKQTNTADMLDLAVEYIKDLQKQYKILRENRANCKCMQKQL